MTMETPYMIYIYMYVCMYVCMYVYMCNQMPIQGSSSSFDGPITPNARLLITKKNQGEMFIWRYLAQFSHRTLRLAAFGILKMGRACFRMVFSMCATYTTLLTTLKMNVEALNHVEPFYQNCP